MIKIMEVTVAEIEGVPVSVRFQVATTNTERAVQEHKIEKVIHAVTRGLQLFAVEQRMAVQQVQDKQPKKIIVAR